MKPMKKYSCIIIDDEENARELIKEYLADYDDIEIIDECKDGFSGFKSIHKLNPDVVFLDIQMPKLTGLEMLEMLEINPVLIFVTAYDKFALEAFERNAADYLLKPFSKERFDSALNKTFSRLSSKNRILVRENLLGHLEVNQDYLNRIVVKTKTGIEIISVDEIVYLEAEDDYVMIHRKDRKFLKQKTLGFYEKHLDPADFIRVHRSSIVRLDQVSRIEKYEKSGGIIILKDNRKLNVSRTGLSRIKAVLDI
jgi:two-component system LytT family response regulator